MKMTVKEQLFKLIEIHVKFNSPVRRKFMELLDTLNQEILNSLLLNQDEEMLNKRRQAYKDIENILEIIDLEPKEALDMELSKLKNRDPDRAF
jgi:GTPase SAR1 family protein